MSYRILLVDDESDILEFVGYNLRREGYEVFTARDGEQGVRAALASLPHLILLDVMMPRMDGMEACRRLREHPALDRTLIAFLSARGEEEQQIEGFGSGADDYIPKPIRMNVLLSRVRALLRRGQEPGDASPRAALRIDRERYVVGLPDGSELTLPRKEFALLALLASQPGRVFSREEIYRSVWGERVVVGDRTIDVHVRKLRSKIGERRIATVKGIGYKFEA